MTELTKYQKPPKTPAQLEQMEYCKKLGADAYKAGKKSTDYLPEFYQILHFTFKTSPSDLLVKYFTGFREAEQEAAGGTSK